MKHAIRGLCLALLSSSLVATPTAFRGQQKNTYVTLHKLEPVKGDILTSKKLRKKYVPLALHIDNKSSADLVVNQDSVGLPLAPINDVFVRLNRDTEYSMLWPLPLLAGLLLVKPVAFIVGYSSLSFFSASALATLHGDRLKNHLRERTSDFSEAVTLPAGKTLRTIVFVPKKQYVGDFNLQLKDRDNDQRVTFAINLLEKQEKIIVETDGGPSYAKATADRHETVKPVIEQAPAPVQVPVPTPKPKVTATPKVKVAPKPIPAPVPVEQPKQQIEVETNVFETIIDFKEQ